MNLNEGDMLLMQGESRMEWAHGVPFGLNSEKYTIMFKFNILPGKSKEMYYSNLLQAKVFQLSLDESSYSCGDDVSVGCSNSISITTKSLPPPKTVPSQGPMCA